MHQRKCLECFEPLLGRADQKFCNDQCRSTYNNKQTLQNKSICTIVNKILKKNYSILMLLHAMGKTSVTKTELEKRGYRLDFYTSMSASRNNKVCYYCYDLGYKEMDNNRLVLLKLTFDE